MLTHYLFFKRFDSPNIQSFFFVSALNCGWQQGGSRVETLPDHGRCYFVVLLGYQPLTDGICDDMLDVVEGIAGETVIELTQEKKGIRERYDSDKKMYT